jgi:hypothetical protein
LCFGAGKHRRLDVMGDELSDLQERLSELPDKDLLQIVRGGGDKDYRKVAMEELKRRQERESVPKSGHCYIEVWRGANFEGENRRIYGPAEYPKLLFGNDDWSDDVGSLRVGPHAFVLAYRDKNFKDAMIAFGPNDTVANLRELKFNDDIDSLKLIDSLKIFDRLPYKSESGTSGDVETGSENLTETSGNPVPHRSKKKRRRKGRRH